MHPTIGRTRIESMVPFVAANRESLKRLGHFVRVGLDDSVNGERGHLPIVVHWFKYLGDGRFLLL